MSTKNFREAADEYRAAIAAHEEATVAYRQASDAVLPTEIGMQGAWDEARKTKRLLFEAVGRGGADQRDLAVRYRDALIAAKAADLAVRNSVALVLSCKEASDASGRHLAAAEEDLAAAAEYSYVS